MELRGRVAMVTGAGSGIGRETAIELARRGATVVLLGRREERLREALPCVGAAAPGSSFVRCDVSSRAEVERAVEVASERHGRIDILVNNAGTMVVKSFLALSPAEFDRHMAVNYQGAVWMTRAVLPAMVREGGGAIVNVASVGGELHLPGTTANSASKAALYAFSEALHYELRDKGIHVGVVLPGGTPTELVEGAARGRLGAYYCAQCRRRDPRGKLPARVASKVADAIERERFETIVPLPESLFLRFRRVFPGLFRSYMLHRLRPYME